MTPVAGVILIGELALWVALLMAAWTTIVSFAGGSSRRDDLIISGYRGMHATFAMTLLASIGLWTGLLGRDLSLRYVADRVSADTRALHAFMAFWSGQEGSLLLWALILSVCSVIAIGYASRRHPELAPFANGTLAAVILLLIASLAFRANPFIRNLWVSPDGGGPSPELAVPGIAVHQPALFLGYIATAIPFAFAVAALISRRMLNEWVGIVRRWALVAWFFLTLGILLRMWWMYVVLGSGRYWNGSLAENASLLPWVTTSTLLHSLTIRERGPRKWSVLLIVASFLLSMLALFLTRRDTIGGVGTGFAAFAMFAAVAAIQLMSPNQRRPGRYLVRGGIVMLFVAFGGMAFRADHDVVLRGGESHEITDPYGRRWRFVSQGLSLYRRQNSEVLSMGLEAWRDGRLVRVLRPEQRSHFNAQRQQVSGPSTGVAWLSGPILDTYVVLAGVPESETADLHVSFNPLVLWVWIGGSAMLIGGLIVMWPETEDPDLDAPVGGLS
ncbi:MAG TPA: cytochrome c biogenesis protein CcsA [Gemmatimonadaceae bacterium]|nr:cytochrome c biogenesis protein CcsA [Gemmatimonadaceae bacterium]